jgi:hypothetical protein
MEVAGAGYSGAENRKGAAAIVLSHFDEKAVLPGRNGDPGDAKG